MGTAADPLPGPGLALVVATNTYTDPGLRQLRAPARDADDLTQVLADPGIGGFAVTTVIDQPTQQIRLAGNTVAGVPADTFELQLLAEAVGRNGVPVKRRDLLSTRNLSCGFWSSQQDPERLQEEPCPPPPMGPRGPATHLPRHHRRMPHYRPEQAGWQGHTAG